MGRFESFDEHTQKEKSKVNIESTLNNFLTLRMRKIQAMNGIWFQF